jgi:hypothetical protein
MRIARATNAAANQRVICAEIAEQSGDVDRAAAERLHG